MAFCLCFVSKLALRGGGRPTPIPIRKTNNPPPPNILLCHVLKTQPDWPVRPVGSSTSHKTGPIECKKPFFDRTDGRTGEPPIEPVVEQAGSLNFFFKLKQRRFDDLYIETMSFYLEL